MNFSIRVPRCAVLSMAVCLSACATGTVNPVDEMLPGAQSPGTFRVNVTHDGLQREALVFVPDTYDAQADTPLVLNFHGFGGYAEAHMAWGDLRDQAEVSGGLLVYPQGSDLDGEPHWNASLPGGDNKSTADDFGFIEALLETIGQSYPFDTGRVSAVGYSNGGMMAMGLACLRSELIASAGSVSGSMLDAGCELAHPVAVITLHGTDDDVIPYEGGGGYLSAQATVDYWTGANGTDAADPVTLTDGGTNIEYWAHEGGEDGRAVHHYRVDGGGHVWLEFEVDGRSANDRIWEFLTAYSVDGRL
jgi:polyhydroxybutyrate depolymerase